MNFCFRTMLIVLWAVTACTEVIVVQSRMSGDMETDSLADVDSAVGTEIGTGVGTGGDSGTGDLDADRCGSALAQVPLVCLDFEDGLPNSRTERFGSVFLETEQVFRGEASMGCATTQINGYAVVSAGFAPIETGTLYFRMHVRVPGGGVTGNTKVLNLGAAGEPASDLDRGVDINIGSDRNVNIYQHGNLMRFTSAPEVVPEDEWFCLRGSYSISRTLGATDVWINDDLVVSTTGSLEAIINGGVSTLRVGIGWTETGQDTALFYFDDVVLATEPIDCIR